MTSTARPCTPWWTRRGELVGAITRQNLQSLPTDPWRRDRGAGRVGRREAGGGIHRRAATGGGSSPGGQRSDGIPARGAPREPQAGRDGFAQRLIAGALAAELHGERTLRACLPFGRRRPAAGPRQHLIIAGRGKPLRKRNGGITRPRRSARVVKATLAIPLRQPDSVASKAPTLSAGGTLRFKELVRAATPIGSGRSGL